MEASRPSTTPGRCAIPFADRIDAGRQLARALEPFRAQDVVVLGLPRGGVPVAFEVARALRAPLDVILVRKLGVPSQPELGMGAIGEDGVRIINPDVVRLARVADEQVAEVERRERDELARRAERFRGDRPRVSLAGRTAIIVDDGIATGSTARAACHVARAHGAAHVVLAAPVASPSAIDGLRQDADEIVVLETPQWFFAIGQWYQDFSQTSDGEVVRLLQMTGARPDCGPSRQSGAGEEVTVVAGTLHLPGILTLPEPSIGTVIFAHGSGSSRLSPRNQFVAQVLHDAGLGTLLFDLLTPTEERDRTNVFDVELLGRRLAAATRWLLQHAGVASIGYFGASTGAAAALSAAADTALGVSAVVSRGGRPDLAGPHLADVRAPTLLIVGANDPVVLDLNREAQRHLHCETRLAIVAGATHLFEEPGTLREAATLARDWFTTHLAASPQLLP